MNKAIAVANQQVAARRQDWAVIDRNCYLEYQEYARREMMEDCTRTFIVWTGERAEYARAAMKEMGITDKDQFYA